jgi:hypothetical protein
VPVDRRAAGPPIGFQPGPFSSDCKNLWVLRIRVFDRRPTSAPIGGPAARRSTHVSMPIHTKGTFLAGFTEGLKRDLVAVRTALSLPCSTGPVEGQICRLMTIKRTMCGRAGVNLLRHRVVEAA